MPLKASLEDGFFYSENLEDSHRKLDFKCPICEVDLIPVIPKKEIIKHFRHKTGKAHGEPDGPEHRAMKIAVKTNADAMGYFSDYEVRLVGEKTRITDVEIIPGFLEKHIMEFNGIAVECQCASMSVDEYNERNQDYMKKGYKPLWILGKRYFEWHISKPKRLVKHILKENNMCYFYIKDTFYKYTLENEEYKVGTSFDKIILDITGYSKTIGTIKLLYKIVDELENRYEYIKKDNDQLIALHDRHILEIEKKSVRLVSKREVIRRQELEISRLETQKRQLNTMNDKLKDEGHSEFTYKESGVPKKDKETIDKTIQKSRIGSGNKISLKHMKRQKNNYFCVDIIRCRSFNICPGYCGFGENVLSSNES